MGDTITLRNRFGDVFFGIELVLFACFMLEYIARVYAFDALAPVDATGEAGSGSVLLLMPL